MTDLDELVALAKAAARPCRGPSCRRRVLMAVNQATGKPIPLDVTPPVYRVERRNGQLVAVRTPASFVSHFATCPDAGRFSSSAAGGSGSSSRTQPPHKAGAEATAPRRR